MRLNINLLNTMQMRIVSSPIVAFGGQIDHPLIDNDHSIKSRNVNNTSMDNNLYDACNTH